MCAALPPVCAPGDTALPYITACEVQQFLARGAAASASKDAVIAIVDRGGHILGVRAEDDVLTTIADDVTRAFAFDGAIAEARTAAFFSNNEAPLTSRTVQFISQTTMTQREIESNPSITAIDSPLRGPGFWRTRPANPLCAKAAWA